MKRDMNEAAQWRDLLHKKDREIEALHRQIDWLTQQLHRAQDGDQPPMQMYELPVQYPADGAKYVPDTVYLPVVK